MVHGNYYGVQYEIYLSKKLDLFNDVLPICIDVRKMISLEKIDKNSDGYKLVIIPYKELDKRFEKRELFDKYVRSLDEISYDRGVTRKTHPELFKYYDVKIYSQHVKHSEEIEPFTAEMFQKLENKVEELTNKCYSDDYWEKYSSEERQKIDSERNFLMGVLKVQRIIQNKDYFEEIKKIERELTDIELTDEEKELINKVLSDVKIDFDCHGINLIDGYY